MIEYPRQTWIPADYIRGKIVQFLKEDAPDGDKTSLASIMPGDNSTVIIEAQEDIILSGGILIPYFYNDDAVIEIFYKDGDFVEKGKTIAEISDKSIQILTAERVLLNLMQRMSGISTITKKYADIADPFNVKILDTRKTTPGLRLFEKYSVVMGGGWNHRMDLSSGILIKDNHIKAAGGIAPAVVRIMKTAPLIPVELEVDNIGQLKEGLETHVDGFLLDNFSPGQIKEAVEIIKKYAGGEDLFYEASGGITLETLPEYVKTGIHAVSVGALTHSVKSAEIHMEIVS